jgi:septum formation protein
MNPLLKKLANTEIILGSGSPRRSQLLKDLGLDFKVIIKDVDETPPEQFRREDTAMFLARKKALAFRPELKENMLVITADTIVAVDELILGKPADAADATRMLQLLSGRKHQVITGVCLLSQLKSEAFFVRTEVSFKTLRPEEISYYIETFKPYDKAGAYGIQEWIGMTGIEYIQGSYFNVMGLPVNELYEQLLRF